MNYIVKHKIQYNTIQNPNPEKQLKHIIKDKHPGSPHHTAVMSEHGKKTGQGGLHSTASASKRSELVYFTLQ